MVFNELSRNHECYIRKDGSVDLIKLRVEIFAHLRYFGRVSPETSCNFFEDVVKLFHEAGVNAPVSKKKTTPVKSKVAVAKASSEETAVKEN